MNVKTSDLLDMWPELQWRHHGTGMMQAYLPNTREYRVHVWHRSLLVPGMTAGGAWHDHRSDLESDILLGSITNSWLDVEVNEEGKHDAWQVVGASDPRATFVRGRRVLLRKGDTDRFEAGGSYSIPKGDFHWSRLEPDDAELTVTTVRLQNKDLALAANILCPVGHEPQHAIAKNTPTAYRRMSALAVKAHDSLVRAESPCRRTRSRTHDLYPIGTSMFCRACDKTFRGEAWKASA